MNGNKHKETISLSTCTCTTLSPNLYKLNTVNDYNYCMVGNFRVFKIPML